MAENSRIDDLRRRVQKDPASIAFAQLAEECRRAGVYQEAVDICRQGLQIHPGYLSARVTLGRALVELNQLDQAQAELARVLESAPENLAAIRGLAEIYHRRGDLAQALAQYRAALLLARNDPDLEQTIADLSRQIEPAQPVETGGLTLQSMQAELLKHAPPPRKPPSAPQQRDRGVRLQADNPAEAGSHEAADNPAEAGSHEAADNPAQAGSHEAAAFDEAEWAYNPASHEVADNPANRLRQGFGAQEAGSHDAALASAEDAAISISEPPADVDDRGTRTVAALEEWLAAIHVARAHRRS